MNRTSIQWNLTSRWCRPSVFLAATCAWVVVCTLGQGQRVACQDHGGTTELRPPDGTSRDVADRNAGDPTATSQSDAEHFFEARIRPVLLDRCLDCHGPDSQSGGLRVDSREALMRGGDTGSAVLPRDLDGSLLIQAIRRSESLAMPPDEPLTDRERADLEQWVAQGAAWTSTLVAEPSRIQRQTVEHWAFQPLRDPGLPTGDEFPTDAQPAMATVVERWIQHPLNAAGLSVLPATDRRTLLRRASYVVTGLPPTAAEVQAFEQDPDPLAYQRRVEALLASPRFGEHWARHWLDLARYSDTKGYVYDREERFWTHAWSYRDWVIESFNRDRPYDEFVRLQLAADQIATDPRDLAAMGFLTVGRRFQGVKPDIFDDRIDVITRGLLGLTVSCARCHDHKYDAIPTADYYSLYGVLASCLEVEKSITPPEQLPPDYLTELHRREEEYRAQHHALREQAATRARQRIGDYLRAQLELENYPDELFGQLFQPDDLLPAVVHRWADYLRRAGRRDDRFFSAWHRWMALPADEFADKAPRVQAELLAAGPERVHPAIAEALATQPVQSHQDVVELYAAVLQRYADGTVAVADGAAAEESAATREVIDLLYGSESPCVVPDEPIVEIEYFLDFPSCEALWKLQREVERWAIQAAALDHRVRTLEDRAVPVEPQIFRRGNPLRKGDFVPRQFVGVLAGPNRQPFQTGSGRRELAEAITDPENPLIARVIVNRVWGHVFGQPLVGTPSDFGLRAELPSHPELLDYLAYQFIQNGWSIKHLVRELLLTETFQRASRVDAPSSGKGMTAGVEPAATRQSDWMAVDPDNRLYWRSPTRRLSIEQLRDSLLAVAGTLDLSQMGGRPSELWAEPFSRRRSIYGLVDRQFLPALLRSFDFANPDLHIPWRSETTVAQQCLFFLNHPLVLEQARVLSAEAAGDADPAGSIRRLFLQVLQREPSEVEVLEAIEFLDQAAADAESSAISGWQQLAQVLLSSNEFLFIE